MGNLANVVDNSSTLVIGQILMKLLDGWVGVSLATSHSILLETQIIIRIQVYFNGIFIARRHAVHASVVLFYQFRLSTCLSVERRYCVQTDEYFVAVFQHSTRGIIVVFYASSSSQISNGTQ